MAASGEAFARRWVIEWQVVIVEVLDDGVRSEGGWQFSEEGNRRALVSRGPMSM